MLEGLKWKFFIFFELVYGVQGVGEMIFFYSIFVFEVELIEVL